MAGLVDLGADFVRKGIVQKVNPTIFSTTSVFKLCLGAKFSLPEAKISFREAKISFREAKFSFREAKFCFRVSDILNTLVVESTVR